jgi:hypothetical protein
MTSTSGGPDGAPDFLTIEEAAEVLRIGRTAAYQLARDFLASDGTRGVPVIRYGRQLRVPRCKLEEQLAGPLSWPPSSTAPQPRDARSRPRRPSTRQLALSVEA